MATAEDIARLQALVDTFGLPIVVATIQDKADEQAGDLVRIGGRIGDGASFVCIEPKVYRQLMLHAGLLSAGLSSMFAPPAPGSPEAMKPIWDLVRVVERECGNTNGQIHSSIEQAIIATIEPLKEHAAASEARAAAVTSVSERLHDLLVNKTDGLADRPEDMAKKITWEVVSVVLVLSQVLRANAAADEDFCKRLRIEGWNDCELTMTTSATYPKGKRVEVYDEAGYGVRPNGVQVGDGSKWVTGTVEFVTGGSRVGGLVGHVSVYCDDGRRVVESAHVRPIAG